MSEQKIITVKEFKMWLEGVEEMQEENWTPDARQWTRIREKINNIAEVDGGPTYSLPPRPQAVREVEQPVYNQPALRAIPAGPSMMPPRMVAPSQLRGPIATGSGQTPVKTPDVDTQSKPYESSFA